MFGKREAEYLDQRNDGCWGTDKPWLQHNCKIPDAEVGIGNIQTLRVGLLFNVESKWINWKWPKPFRVRYNLRSHPSYIAAAVPSSNIAFYMQQTLHLEIQRETPVIKNEMHVKGMENRGKSWKKSWKIIKIAPLIYCYGAALLQCRFHMQQSVQFKIKRKTF